MAKKRIPASADIVICLLHTLKETEAPKEEELALSIPLEQWFSNGGTHTPRGALEYSGGY